MRYESIDDVRLRLVHSVVMHKGVPVLVQDVEDIDTVVVSALLTDKFSKANILELDLTPSHAPLGYVLHNDDCYIAMRKPVRRYKQGLTQENMISRLVLPNAKGDVRERLGRGLLYCSKSVAQTMLNQFPDVGEAFQRVRAGHMRVCPFDREWAVAMHEDDLSIVFRGEVVGYVGDNDVHLLPERFYLQESLALCLK